MSAELIDWLEFGEAIRMAPPSEWNTLDKKTRHRVERCIEAASTAAWKDFLETHLIEEIQTWAQKHRPELFKRWLAWVDESKGDRDVNAEIILAYLKREEGQP